jgi:phage shock protein PspC (stress-responsive transcriptional regulator)
MQRVIDIHLAGHPNPFRLDEDAYDALRTYLDRARAGVADAADQAEVADDLERSIGTKLTDRMGEASRILTIADVDAVLTDIGPVAGGEPAGGFGPVGGGRTRPRRRLYRIREGQQIAGVCEGLAAYSEIDVAWVRTIFVFATLVTFGFFLLVYLALAFILPVVPSHDAWFAAMDDAT